MKSETFCAIPSQFVPPLGPEYCARTSGFHSLGVPTEFEPEKKEKEIAAAALTNALSIPSGWKRNSLAQGRINKLPRTSAYSDDEKPSPH